MHFKNVRHPPPASNYEQQYAFATKFKSYSVQMVRDYQVEKISFFNHQAFPNLISQAFNISEIKNV